MDFEDIRRQVIDAGGIKCFPMQVLREASPYKKLGPGVIEELEASLAQRGLCHGQMGRYQEDWVYVYDPNSKAGRLCAAVTDEVSEQGAETILKAVAPDVEAQRDKDTLAEIKALLVQMQDVFADAASGAA
jgi:hypothetical protein